MTQESDLLYFLLRQHRKQLRRASTSLPSKKLRRWSYPWSIEQQYVKYLQSIFAGMSAYVLDYVKQVGEPLLRGDSDFHCDALPGKTFKLLISTLSGWMVKFAANKPQLVMGLGDIGSSLKAFTSRRWNSSTKTMLGFEFDQSAPWWDDVRTNWADTNYELIVSNTQRYVAQINDLTEKAVVNGWGYQSLIGDLETLGAEMEGPRARLIARDQIGKLNSYISQAEQASAGISMYIWRTAGDERVRGMPGGKWQYAIPSHWAMEGKLCRWDNSNVYSEDGGTTWLQRGSDMPLSHPGIEIQCRCQAIPFFDLMVGVIDEQLNAEAF